MLFAYVKRTCFGRIRVPSATCSWPLRGFWHCRLYALTAPCISTGGWYPGSAHLFPFADCFGIMQIGSQRSDRTCERFAALPQNLVGRLDSWIAAISSDREDTAWSG